MNEEGLIKKVIEYLGKIMSRYTEDRLICGDGYIEFTDRKIEVIPPDKVRITKDGWEVVSDTIDKQKIKEEFRTAKEDIVKGMSPLGVLKTFELELGLK